MCQSLAPSSTVVIAPPRHGAAGCACTHNPKAMPVGEEVTWKDASVDLEFPPVPFPSRRVFAELGESALRSLVLRHHERLLNTAISHLFPSDPERFAAGTTKAADFVVEACGGPACYTPVQGDTCMRTRHFPFTIDEQGREIWLAELLLAFDDVGFPEGVREEYWNWVEALSIRMINRRTQRAQLRRYPWVEARTTLAPFMATWRRPVACMR